MEKSLMNGTNLMKEIRKFAQEEKLDADEGLRITLAAIADVLENQHEMGSRIDKQGVTFTVALEKHMKYVKDNIMFKVGLFIRHNRKLFWALVGLTFILSNLWFVPELRVGVATLLVPLGFPMEWVVFLGG
jgi:hypothetical protein